MAVLVAGAVMTVLFDVAAADSAVMTALLEVVLAEATVMMALFAVVLAEVLLAGVVLTEAAALTAVAVAATSAVFAAADVGCLTFDLMLMVCAGGPLTVRAAWPLNRRGRVSTGPGRLR